VKNSSGTTRDKQLEAPCEVAIWALLCPAMLDLGIHVLRHHESMHLGQLCAAWRQSNGMPAALGHPVGR